MKKHQRHIIVIGASAGGFAALTKLLSLLDKKINAAVFIALHFSRGAGDDLIIKKIKDAAAMNVRKAANKLAIRTGNIYVAPANTHLLLKEDKMVLGYGPAEDRWRPSIDILFRSAAVAYNSAVTGIILTGLLNDGTAGMMAIKECGGTCIVQHPQEAQYDAMPLSVIDSLEADYILRLDEMPEILHRLTQTKPAVTKVPEHVVEEATIAERVITNNDMVQQIGAPGSFACPACGGTLWKLNGGKVTRFRCHIGHSFTEENLLERQGETLEATLWIALRIMEERKNMLIKMAETSRRRNYQISATDYTKKANGLDKHINNIKEILKTAQESESCA